MRHCVLRASETASLEKRYKVAHTGAGAWNVVMSVCDTVEIALPWTYPRMTKVMDEQLKVEVVGECLSEWTR